MIKKIVLLLLVLILIPLTYLLYQQMEALAPAKKLPLLQEAEQAEQNLDTRKMMRQWTPPRRETQPVAEKTKSAARSDPAGENAPENAGKTEALVPTDKEMLSPQQEVAKLMSELQARGLRQESPTALQQAPKKTQKQGAFPDPQPLPGGVNTLKTLRVLPDESGANMQVVCLGAIAGYKYFSIGSPNRIVVDLLGKYARPAPEQQIRDNAFIKAIRTGRHPDKLRIVADLKDGVRVRLSVEKAQSNVLRVRLSRK